MNKIINIIIGLLLCLILLASVRNFSFLKIGVGQVYYFGGYSLSILALYSFFVNKKIQSVTYIAPILYIIWALFGAFRGAFEVSSGWIMNQYFHGILYVLVPLCIFLFALPDTIIRSFQILNIFTITYSFLSFGWNFSFGTYVFALTPFYYFYLCFLPKIPKKWMYITIVSVVFVLLAVSVRSAAVKVIASISVLFIFHLPNYAQKITFNITHSLLYIIPTILLYLGLTGQYNIFEGDSESNNITISDKGIEGQKERHIDTRTFLYEEVIASLKDNDCIIWGCTPARGYYSPYFANDEVYIPGKEFGERFETEVGHLNTLNWLGIIGLILMTFVYLQGSCLALYFSNNKYVKCISIEVAFMWMWAWIENINQFHMLDLMIFVLLAICYSPYFRKMTDLEFELFFKSIFRWPGEKLHDYNKYLIQKLWVAQKLSEKTK